MPLGWIGVDLGTHAMKAAQLEQQGMLLRLSASAVMQRESPVTGAPAAGWTAREIRQLLKSRYCCAKRWQVPNLDAELHDRLH